MRAYKQTRQIWTTTIYALLLKMNLKNPSLGLTVCGLSRCWLHEAITTVRTVDIVRKHLFLCFHVEKRRDSDTVHREAPAVTASERRYRPPPTNPLTTT